MAELPFNIDDENDSMEEEMDRVARDFESREMSERPKQWRPATTLPEPDREPGYTYRWVRVSSMSNADASNVAGKFREGWDPVKVEEQPQFKHFRDANSRFEDSIEIGGLLLCKIPTEFVEQRKAYFKNLNKAQMESVDNNFMRENDQRMPLFRERRSTTSFGNGR